MDVWAAFQHRFVQGGRWDETAFYSRILDTIRRGIPKWRCRTAEEVDARFKQIDALFDEIKNEGYRSQLDIDPSMRFGEEDEISVHIGREGDYLFVNGRHRLCIAKILKIDKVPVKVLRRHAKWVSFRKEILAYMEREKAKKLYAPVLHPDLADIPCVHGHDRMEILQAHIPPRSGTVLDLGAHWGYFCHRFEDLGFKCTAIESSPMHAYFMRKLKRAEQKKFDIVEGSVLNLNFADSYDVVLALNIFHHFLKQEDLHTGVIQLLGRLHAGVMFFEPHQPDEPQMQGSFRNYGPEEFVAFVKQHGHFASVSNIGWATNGRPMFKLVR
jgi:2-polyprenyl-3-methyl-5-hydroxy-6-metoxy-1,4-benzoquinol methylase